VGVGDQAIIKAYRTAFLPDEKVVVLTDLAEFCNFVSVTHHREGEHQSAFEEGRRSVILYILTMLGITDVQRITQALGTIRIEFKEAQATADEEEA
jgi:hypothetical protein